MTKTLSEGYNPNILNESMVNFNMNELAQYVMQEDKRIEAICESLGFNIERDLSNVEIDRYNKLCSIKEGNETLKLFLKNSVVNNMDNYFKLRF